MPQSAPELRAKRVKLDPSQAGSEVRELLERLQERVIGQDAAIQELIRSYVCFKAGLCAPNRPVGVFLLVGPTGSGKTYLVKQICELVTGAPNNLIRLDCGEFSQSHEVARLLGAPPGYLGHRETQPIITQQRLNNNVGAGGLSFVLFDEVEKAHPRLLDLLLGVCDDGKLRLGDNTQVDFSRTMLLLTSNTGAKEMQEALSPTAGFGRITGHHSSAEKAGNLGEGAARRALRPEMVNRLDKILVFQQLTRAQIQQVLQLELGLLEMRLLQAAGVGLLLTQEAKDYLLELGYDAKFGARHLKRNLAQKLELPIANLLTSDQVVRGSVIWAEKGPDGLEFHA